MGSGLISAYDQTRLLWMAALGSLVQNPRWRMNYSLLSNFHPNGTAAVGADLFRQYQKGTYTKLSLLSHTHTHSHDDIVKISWIIKHNFSP